MATYIPELGPADPGWFGICVVTADGHVYEVGDTDLDVTIRSISKPFVFGMALEDQGPTRSSTTSEWVDAVIDSYFRQCSLLVTCRDLATRAATDGSRASVLASRSVRWRSSTMASVRPVSSPNATRSSLACRSRSCTTSTGLLRG